MKKRLSFTREFKLEAVRLLKSSGKPAAELARELGVRDPIIRDRFIFHSLQINTP